jgi:hypothetical protein
MVNWIVNLSFTQALREISARIQSFFISIFFSTLSQKKKKKREEKKKRKRSYLRSKLKLSLVPKLNIVNSI